MKKTIFFLALLLSSLGAFAQWYDFSADAPSGQTLYYNIISDNLHTCEVARNSGATGNIIIPENVTYSGNTYTVIRIGNSAFQGCTDLTGVTIPSSVTSIENYAFQNCTGLTGVTIPNTVTAIKAGAFNGCRFTSVTIPESVDTIGMLAFAGNRRLTSVNFNATNCTLMDGEESNPVFSNCTNLTTLTIGEGVTNIPDYAFYGCGSLDYVTIPNSVTSIGNNAFDKCSGLQSVTIGNSVTNIGNFAFSECYGLSSVTIGRSVTSIGDYAFFYCQNLASVTIPNSVTTIGNLAFRGCSGLTNVTIGNSVTTIGSSAFNGCGSLQSMNVYADQVPVLGTSVFTNVPTNIPVTIWPYSASRVTEYQTAGWPFTNYICPGYYLFYALDDESGTATVYGSQDWDPNSVAIVHVGLLADLNILSSVEYNERTYSVTAIGEYAFWDANLSSVTIPNSVITIGGDAFNGCSNLTSVTIGESVETIGGGAFNSCSGLTSITIPESVTTIGRSAFFQCTGLTSITIPDLVTSIGTQAFTDCSSLTSVTIGNSVTTIEAFSFLGCSGLTSVTIPNSVTNIGSSAFYNCSGLTNVTIGNSVTTIGNSAFSGCTQLATVYDYSNLPITRDSYEYGGVAQYATKVVKVLTDERGDFNAPNDYIVDEVTYTRNYDQGNRSTLCLPFKPETVKVNGQPTTDLKFYAFANFDGTTITFDEVAFANLQANTPYMVEWTESKVAQDFVFGATNATIPATGDANSRTVTNGNGSFIGTMTRECMTSSNYGYKNGYFVQSADGTQEEPADHAHVNPFRAYFQITPSGSQGFAMPTELSVRFNTVEDNVGIDNVEPQQSNIRYSNDVYDMMGRMVRKNAESLDGLRKGVYIWKGEKKIVF